MIPGVPYDAEIEYLESTGTQWIDSGIYWTPTQTKFVGKVHYSKEAGAYSAAPQSRDTVGSTMYYHYGFNLKNSSLYHWPRLQVADKFIDNFDFVTQINTKYEFSVECINNNIVAFVDGQQICTLSNASSLRTSSNTLFMYARNNGGGEVGIYADGLCYHYLKIYSGSTLVRDFIPVRVGQTGYMYDRVTKRLFGNNGTGSFVLGPDVAKPVMGLWGMRKFTTAKDYVQDGLTNMWDGINNTSHGHDQEATVWKDFVGGNDITLTMGGGGWTETALHTAYSPPITGNFARGETSYKQIEVVGMELTSIPNYDRHILLTFNPTHSFVIGQNRIGFCVAHNVSGIAITYPSTSRANIPFSVSIGYTDANAPDPQNMYYLGVKEQQTGNNIGLYNTNTYFNYYKGGSYYGGNSYIYCIRLYSRSLSPAEIAHNYAIDKARFNLP